MRYRTLFFVLPGLTMAIALTGCGAEKAGDGPAQPSSSGPGWATGATTQSPGQGDGSTTLKVAFKPSAKAPVKTWTLTCDPVGGDHPNAEPACAALAAAAAAGKDPFAPTPKDQACTTIYGGPETSTVTGTWQDKKIDANFSRQDGCQVTRWATLAPLLGEIPRPR
jgi:hypothetical protein